MSPTVVATRSYSTNNAWGFGGSYGTETEWSDGWKLRVGKLCYRHPNAAHPKRACYAVNPRGQRFLDLHTRKTCPASIPAHVFAAIA